MPPRAESTTRRSRHECPQSYALASAVPLPIAYGAPHVGLARQFEPRPWDTGLMVTSRHLFDSDWPRGVRYREDFITDADERVLREAIAGARAQVRSKAQLVQPQWIMSKILGTLLLSLTLSAVLSAQGHGDFSGTWKLDEARSGSPGWAEFVRPVMRVIRLSPSVVEIDVTEGVKTTSFRYPLTAVKPVGGKDTSASNRAYWEGDRLITETMHALSGQTVTMREALTIAPDGKELFVERLVEVEHGYAMRGAKNNSMVRDVFVRVIP